MDIIRLWVLKFRIPTESLIAYLGLGHMGGGDPHSGSVFYKAS